MIQANELMIGNWVEISNDPLWTPECVGTPRLVDCESFKEIASFGEKIFNPIPLTPEILEKSLPHTAMGGFYKVGDSHIISHEAQLYFEGYDNALHPVRDIRYVHQLQNLYFALTNQPLKIEL